MVACRVPTLRQKVDCEMTEKKQRRDKRRQSDVPVVLDNIGNHSDSNLSDIPWDVPDYPVKRQRGDSHKPLPLQSGAMNLAGWIADKYEYHEDKMVVYATCIQYADPCENCHFDDSFIRYGSQRQTYHDLPYHAKPTEIVVERQRLRCKNCGKTQFQSLPDMDTKHMMTQRLVLYVREQSMKRTFTSIAADIGVSEKTVRRIFSAYADELEKTHKVYTPEWLGIDEVHLTRQMRCVMTDVHRRKPLDILKDRSKPTVVRWLRKNINPDEVKVVTMDMYTGYYNAVGEVLPNAKIIVDKFHVVRAANKAMEYVRKSTHTLVSEYQRKQLKHDRKIMLMRRDALNEQQRFILETWLGNFEDLGKAYLLKEAFYDIYSFTTKYEAEMAYRVWLDDLNSQSDLVREAFSELTTSMTNWHDPIFNYFDYRATNAYTESLNGMLKQIYRNGRGYSFKAIRAKVLYGKIDHQR